MHAAQGGYGFGGLEIRPRLTTIEFDPDKHCFGSLCINNHEYNDTGKSIRYKSNRRCVFCACEYTRKMQKKADVKKAQIEHGRKNAELHYKIDTKVFFIGNLCKYKHYYKDTTGSLRHAVSRKCVICTTPTKNKEQPYSQMKNIRMEIRFKNNELYKKIFRKYDSVADFCRKTGISAMTVHGYLNLKMSPVSRIKRHGTIMIGGLNIKGSAVKISKVLSTNIFDLFPKDLWNVVSKKFAIEIDSTCFLEYDDRQQLSTIESDDLKEFYDIDRIDEVLSVLSAKEEHVIRGRIFDDESFAEIARSLNLTTERVRQMEAVALRKLRHPKRKRMLRKK